MALQSSRTAVEADLYLALLPCERCGGNATDWTYLARLAVDGQPVDRYGGQCRDCGDVREHLFAVSKPGPTVPDGQRVTRFGAGHSELLDAKQWIAVAVAAEVAADDETQIDERRRLADLVYARDAYEEALKLVPDEWLAAQRARVVADVSDLRGDSPHEPAKAADLQRQRIWLRERLLTMARAICPNGMITLERDEGPVSPDPDHDPASALCGVTVSAAAPGTSWDAPDAVDRAIRLLADDGWTVTDPHDDGRRSLATAERNGFLVHVVMFHREGILRLAGETPEHRISPDDPDVS